jgi:hypothetical protein
MTQILQSDIFLLSHKIRIIINTAAWVDCISHIPGSVEHNKHTLRYPITEGTFTYLSKLVTVNICTLKCTFVNTEQYFLNTTQTILLL